MLRREGPRGRGNSLSGGYASLGKRFRYSARLRAAGMQGRQVVLTEELSWIQQSAPGKLCDP